MKTSPLVQKLKHARPLLLLGLVLPLTTAIVAETVRLNPAVRTGRLANGLTYYIRQNTKPEKRVELRLAVNAGSVQEDDDQRGLAHFVEHLIFRGTARYPGVDLIHYLQSLGAGFGPDINATTSFNETVYRLTLPTNSEDTLRQGVEILSNWAHGVTQTPADIDMERVLRICRDVGVLGFIEQLPQGFFTHLNENGANLSGGQRQRLALVRALYLDAPILLLDEPSSALDAKSEKIFFSLLARLRDEGKTIVLAAHSSTALAIADHIVALDQGKLAKPPAEDSSNSRQRRNEDANRGEATLSVAVA